MSSTAPPPPSADAPSPASTPGPSPIGDPIPPMPLAEAYRAHGARLAPWRGALAPADFGDAGAERRTLLEGSGVLDASGEAALEATGADRVRFLDGQVTCHVGGVADGGGAYGFFVSAKGRVESDVRVLGMGERLLLAFPPARRRAMHDRLEKYVILDRVSFEDLDARPLRLVGPKTPELLAGLLGEIPADPWGHREVPALGAAELGAGARLVREPSLRLGDRELPVFELWLGEERAPSALEALIGAGADPVGHLAFDAVRIAAGLPLYGVDFGDECFPQETGLGEVGVSYTKGCYLGQEVVARIHYRGGVQRTLRRLRLPTEADVPPGSRLLRDGKEVGRLTSAGRLGEEHFGLAVVHRKAEPGTAVDVESAAGEPLGSAGLEELEG
ncbi:MAG: hypothetical protein MI919_37190 [Holophagales bacterium]|nr:hypothetical protein [Holophagales bacterium]